MLPASKETELAATHILVLLSFPALGKFFPHMFIYF